MKQLIISYILNRLREASTWRGIIMLVAGGWATQNPEQAEAIIPIAIALAGATGAFMPDKKMPAAIDSPSNGDSEALVRKQPPVEEDAEPTSGWGDKS